MAVNKQPLDLEGYPIERPASNIYLSIVAGHGGSGNLVGAHNYRDLTGQVFGRLTCVRDVGRDKQSNDIIRSKKA